MLKTDPALESEADPTQAGKQSEAARAYKVLVVHHTHWDREWWATYQQFRVLLVELIDELLDVLDRDASFRTFLLDAQTIVLRDYLEVRPEKRARLVAGIREGRIECGPWYILPDEFLVSGESHVRNLLLGKRIAQELGVPLRNYGYLPDTFGHIAQMPQLLRGFGIGNAFVWRGHYARRQEFLWRSPDGSELLTHWFPNGYYQMPFLHFDNDKRPEGDKMGRVLRAIEDFGELATTPYLLLPYGGDHRPVDPELAAKIERTNQVVGERAQVEWGTLGEYVEAIRGEAPELETWNGELRDSGPESPHLLTGVLSSRLYLKKLNFECQRSLSSYTEPIQALARAFGGKYDRSLTWKAWELLIQNHPHDSICGCSIDEVHRENVNRFAQSGQIADVLSLRAAGFIADRINTADHDDDFAAVVFNTLPFMRSGRVAVEFEKMDIDPHTHALLDTDSNELTFSVWAVRGSRTLCDKGEHTEIEFRAENIPAIGYKTFRLVKREAPLEARQPLYAAIQPVALMKGSHARTDLRVGRSTLENRYLTVAVDPASGTLSITDKLSGHVYDGLNEYVDGGDSGDTYSYGEPLNDMVLSSRHSRRIHVSVIRASAARATLHIDVEWDLPRELTPDRLSRSALYLPVRLGTSVTLAAGTRWLEVESTFDNGAKDHRLRSIFPLGAVAQASHAAGQFAVTSRPIEMPADGNGWPELPVGTQPQGDWVAVEGDGRGLLIANQGLPEYEIVADSGSSAIALTLLRAVGWLSRDDIPSRVAGAGPEIEVPDAQCQGAIVNRYAIIPYEGTWLTSGAYRAAEEYLVPLYGRPTGIHAGSLPGSSGLLELSGQHTFLMSACKQSEESDDLVLRLWNVASQPTKSVLHVWKRPESIRLLDLKEHPTGTELSRQADGSFQIAAEAAEIVTVGISF